MSEKSAAEQSSAKSTHPNPRLLRVVTYNVHKCRGLDRRVRPERIAQVLRLTHADVIAIQEIFGPGGAPDVDQVSAIAASLPGYTAYFGEVRHHRDVPYGNSVLSRLPVKLARNYDITWRGRERRGCFRADLDFCGTVVHVFNVHLGTSYFERPHQARALLSEDVLNARDLQGPRIVVGDFNEWTRGVASRLMAHNFKSVDRKLFRLRPTFPSIAPVLHLDHFYYDTHLRLEGFSVIRTPLALIASDHLPIVADFRLAPHRADLQARFV